MVANHSGFLRGGKATSVVKPLGSLGLRLSRYTLFMEVFVPTIGVILLMLFGVTIRSHVLFGLSPLWSRRKILQIGEPYILLIYDKMGVVAVSPLKSLL